MVTDILQFFAYRFAQIIDFMGNTRIFGNITILGLYISIAILSILVSVFIWLLLPWKGALNPSSSYIKKARYEKNKARNENNSKRGVKN